jgi:hypothetical protein
MDARDGSYRFGNVWEEIIENNDIIIIISIISSYLGAFDSRRWGKHESTIFYQKNSNEVGNNVDISNIHIISTIYIGN